jgi:diguanylate cyclase (GGDEF)-like protein/PAS domain S-box-containing protein
MEFKPIQPISPVPSSVPLPTISPSGWSLNRLSVRGQLWLLIVAILLPVFSAQAWYLMRERELAQGRVHAQVKQLSALIASDLSVYMDTVSRDPVQVNEWLNRIAPENALVYVRDADRAVVFQVPLEGMDAPNLPILLSAQHGKPMSGKHFYAPDASGVVRIWGVNQLPGSPWSVLLGVREDESVAAPTRALRNGFLAALLLLAVSLFMAWRLSQRIVRPIDALAALAASVAAGDHRARAALKNVPPEVGAVGEEFNRMLDAYAATETALITREQRLSFLLTRSSAAIFISEASGDFRFTFVSDGIRNLMGCTPQEFLSEPGYWLSHMHPDDAKKFAAIKPQLMALGNLVFEYRFMHTDGQYRWLRDEVRLFKDDAGAPKELVGFVVDVTESHAASEALQESEAQFRTLTRLSSDWFWQQDKAFRFIGMVGDMQYVGGMPIPEHFGKCRWDIPALNLTEDDWARHRATLEAHAEFRDFEIRRPDVNGQAHWVSVSGSPMFDRNGEFCGYRGVGRDISQEKLAAEQIHALAFYDALTGLPNRRLLTEQLNKSMASHVRRSQFAALLFIDLDNFKTLNDSLGHDMGDMLLQQVASRLLECVREGDTVARLGGDEFVVMVEALSNNELDAATQAEDLGEKILSTLNRTYQLGIYFHHSAASIGVTLFGQVKEAMDEPLKRADMAMYQAKAAGRNAIRFFDPQMQAAVTKRANMEAGLREALATQQFVVCYQPQVKHNRIVTGVEALVRWQHPELGMISPTEFVPLAEETGLILPLGHWVLETACVQLARWALQPDLANLSVAVNVSPRQFSQPQFVSEVLEVLKRTGASARLLKLELTESMLVTNVEDVDLKMAALKRAGLGFALDDFGTGYSSLSLLKRLPLDMLKIDQGFVRDILTDVNDAAIAKLVVALADSLGLEVMAEGVETHAQRDLLASQGCMAYQGNLFGRPMGVKVFEQFMADGPFKLARIA